MLTAIRGAPVEVLLAQQAASLADARYFETRAARWAVETIAIAVGLRLPDGGQAGAPNSPPSSLARPAAAPSPRRGPRPDSLSLTIAPGVVLELVRVPAGPFLMGSAESDGEADSDEKPQHTVALREYYIGKRPVTVAQFAAFVKATSYMTAAELERFGFCWQNPQYSEVEGADWQHPRGPGNDVSQKSSHPVTQVSWDDAVAFTVWAGEVAGRVVRLPTEAEWEKAARGVDGRIYPWGNDTPDDTRCNFDSNLQDTTPVAMYSPEGESPYGLVDTSGNVWEWTASLYVTYPYAADDGREDPASREERVLRGGSFSDTAGDVRSTYRENDLPDFRRDDNGFRVAVSSI